MKYKPGDVQKILGVSVDTLRFFERKGLIEPERNHLNNYRSFDTLDLNKIIAYKLYRSLDFSLDESLEMVNGSNELQREHLMNQEGLIAEKILNYQQVLKRIKEILENYKNAEELAGGFRIEKCPEMLVFYNQKNDEFEESEQILKANKKWIHHLPYIELIFHIPKEGSLLSETIHFGYALRGSNADAAVQLKDCSSRQIPSQLCLHTLIQCTADEPISTGYFSPALTYMEEQGYELSDDVTGWILNEENQGSEKIQFFECWIPIRKK